MSAWVWGVIGYLCVGALFGEIYTRTSRWLRGCMLTWGGYVVAVMLWPLVLAGSLFMKLTPEDRADVERFKRDRRQRRDRRD